MDKRLYYENYVMNQRENISVKIHECPGFMDNKTIFMEFIYPDQRHIVCFDVESGEAIANELLKVVNSIKEKLPVNN